jgi:hypothetical protein
MPENLSEEVDRLIAEFGAEAVAHLVDRIERAISNNDDATTVQLDRRLRLVEKRLGLG